MQSAQHVLTHRLLAQQTYRTSQRLSGTRSLATRAHVRDSRSGSREVDRLQRSSHGRSMGALPGKSGYKIMMLTSRERHQLTERKNFIPWLSYHLQSLIRKLGDKDVEEKAYRKFLINLVPVLKSDTTWRALGIDESKEPRRTAWMPTEQSRPVSLFKSLKAAFLADGEAGVDSQLKYSYRGLVAGYLSSKGSFEGLHQLADLRFPTEWYPGTRQIQRSIHLHVGPTNSGKTYRALKCLEQAESGIYAGPLRLLAHEVYTRLNTQGKTCDLVTGDEQVFKDSGTGPRMMSCTVEMVPLNTIVDVAVIDEIQMIGDKERGWAWTQALLGVKAKEVHLCGEERTVPLIRELVASMGDRLEIHTYKRLSPLRTMSASLRGDLKNLRKGDCLVVFSRVGIHAMKTQIEKMTEKRVAIVYGSLPPEVRAQQASLFNDPNNDYDILVASDAIGMGLNLAIKRIIFETVTKFNGSFFETIHPSQIKQIAGRAGRFRTAPPAQSVSRGLAGKINVTNGAPFDAPAPPSSLGLITTLEEPELAVVRKAMQNEAEPITTAGIIPPSSTMERFASYFPPSTSFSYILLRFQELAVLHPRFHLCDVNDRTGIADMIQPIEGLTINDRLIFCAAPAYPRDPGMPAILAAYARCVGENTNGELLDIPEIPLEVLDEEIRLDREYLRRLESLHKSLILYLWLSYRFSGVFISQSMAFYVKHIAEERIDNVLADFSASPAIKMQIQTMKKATLKRARELSEMDQSSKNSAARNEIIRGQLPAAADTNTSEDEDQGPEYQTLEIEPETMAQDNVQSSEEGEEAERPAIAPSSSG